jgi:hypothetical protein
MGISTWDVEEMRLYRIELDDGEHYAFGLLDLAHAAGAVCAILPGARSSHVLITPLAPRGKSHLFDKHALVSPYYTYARYVREKTGLPLHACAAVILAAGWLIQYPDDISGAARRARFAPALLAGKDLQQEAWDRLEEYRATL